MSSVNIFEKSWLDLVFEGKNKEYGAYQLRQENSKTTLLALLLGVLLFSGAISAVVLASKFKSGIEVDRPPLIDIIVRPIAFPPNEPKPNVAAAPLKKEKTQTEVTKKEELVNVTIVEKEQAQQNIATNKENSASPIISGDAAGSTSSTVGGTGTVETPIAGTGTDIAVNTSMLDKLPEFPGGIGKFYSYVGNNFRSPEVEMETAKVLMSFVIEKDGTMTDIKVLKSPGYGLDKEAIRVLKSLRTQWVPGVKDGQPMRTIYTLPITVRIN